MKIHLMAPNHPALLRLVVALIFAAALSTAMAAARQGVHPVLGIESARYEAMMSRNREALAPFLADELVYIYSDGIKENKVQLLDAIEAGDITYLSITPIESKVRDHGRWAIVTGIVNMKVRTRGHDLSSDLLFTAIYERIDRRWQLVSWQSTRAKI